MSRQHELANAVNINGELNKGGSFLQVDWEPRTEYTDTLTHRNSEGGGKKKTSVESFGLLLILLIYQCSYLADAPKHLTV